MRLGTLAEYKKTCAPPGAAAGLEIESCIVYALQPRSLNHLPFEEQQAGQTYSHVELSTAHSSMRPLMLLLLLQLLVSTIVCGFDTSRIFVLLVTSDLLVTSY